MIFYQISYLIEVSVENWYVNIEATNETVILTPEVLDIAIRGAFSNILVPTTCSLLAGVFIDPKPPTVCFRLGPNITGWHWMKTTWF